MGDKIDRDRWSGTARGVLAGVTTIPKEQLPSEAKDFDEMEHAVATRASDQVGNSRQACDQSLLVYSDRLSELNVVARSTKIRNESRAVLSISQVSRIYRSRLCTKVSTIPPWRMSQKHRNSYTRLKLAVLRAYDGEVMVPNEPNWGFGALGNPLRTVLTERRRTRACHVV
jgi:hypothetical protein